MGSTAGSETTIVAADGYELGAVRFVPDGRPHARILVAGATAVPQRFYRRFAESAAARGYEVLTLDYRGVGASAPPSLRGFRMDFTDWARLDLAAAIDTLDIDTRPLYVVGHSYGGVCFGLVPEPGRVRGVYAFGAGAGWHGWMPPLERVRVLTMWNVLGPPLTTALGYLPWSRLMSGEDLPADVFWQWRRWCSKPHFVLDDDRIPDARAQFARVTTPMVMANALDDRWAPPRSRDAIMTGYVRSPWRGVTVDPATAGPTGHMGYFRPAAAPLWDDVFATFESWR